jgi:hypothetical protein
MVGARVETGRMAREIANGHGSQRRRVDDFSMRIHARINPQIGELRGVLGKRIVELKLPGLVRLPYRGLIFVTSRHTLRAER